MLKKALTYATAIVAVGGAFVGNANARNLLINQGWYLVQEGEDVNVGLEAPTATCPGGTDITCAYFLNEAGQTVPGQRLTNPLP